VRLGHLSDLHLADRRRYPRNGFTARDCDRHSAALGQRLLRALAGAGVDHLVVTGDLTLSSEASEFEKAAALLRPWSERGRLTAVPGNHDVWTAEAVRTSRFLRLLGADGRGMRRPAPAFPRAVVASPEVTLIALDSARPGDEPYETPGRLGRLEAWLLREERGDDVAPRLAGGDGRPEVLGHLVGAVRRPGPGEQRGEHLRPLVPARPRLGPLAGAPSARHPSPRGRAV